MVRNDLFSMFVSGVALVRPSEEQKESSMQGMMQQMMGGEKAGKDMLWARSSVTGTGTSRR